MGNLEKYRETCPQMEREDIRRALDGSLPFKQLNRKTVLVTGASGLIGKAVIKFLIEYGKRSGLEITVIGLCRSRKKAEAALGEYLNGKNLKMIYQDIVSPVNLNEAVDYIIHGASVTASGSFVKYPVETINTALEGTRNILELARRKRVSGMVYLSSLEVYGVAERQEKNVTEEDYGYLDPMNVRSSYSEGKRMAECLCVSYGSEYGVPVKIARLGQTFGCGVSYEDTRVFAEFARCIAEKKDIVLHTEGKTVRNYCYTVDAATAILFILLYGERQNAYNVASRDAEVSIYGMAEQMIAVSDSSIKIRVELGDTSAFGYNPTARTVLDTKKLEGLGWKPAFSFEEMLKNLIGYMKVRYESINSSSENEV